MQTLPLPATAPNSAEIEAARRMLERIYQTESAAALSGNVAAQRAGGLLIKGASTALLTVGIWAAMEQPAGLPVLQEELLVNGPRGMFDKWEEMLAEKGGDTQAVRALRTSVIGMLDNGQVHSAGLLLGETLSQLQEGGLISRHVTPADLGIDCALRYAQQHPSVARPPEQASAASSPPSPLVGSYNSVPQPPALSAELQTLRDRIAAGQYANSEDAYNQGIGAYNGLIEQVNGLRERGVPTLDNRALEVAAVELDGRRHNSVLGQYVRNAEDGGPLPSSGDMQRYLDGVRGFDQAVQQQFGRPMFAPGALDQMGERVTSTIQFREDFSRFNDRATSGQFANSSQSYEQGMEQLEQFRIRANGLATNLGVQAMDPQQYQEALFQIEGRRINSVASYVGSQLNAGQPIDPEITESLVNRAQNLNQRRQNAGGDLFDANTLDSYRDQHSIASFREDYRQFNAQVMSGAFANSAETHQQATQQLQQFGERANTMASDQGVQPLPQITFDETRFQLDGRRINSQLTQIQRDVSEGRAADLEVTRDLVQSAAQLNEQRRQTGSGDLFEPDLMQSYRDLQRTVEQAAGAPAVASPPGTEQPQPGSNPEQPPAEQPQAPERDIEREWGEEFGFGDLADDIRREADRNGISQEDVLEHARRNPDRTANEILSQIRDGALGIGGTPPNNRPPGTTFAAPGQPDDERTPAQMAQPLPIQYNGRSYDIIGVNDGERPSLEVLSHNAVSRFVPADALVPRPAGEPHPDAQARQVTVVQKDASGTETRELYDIAGVRPDGLQLSRQGSNGTEQRFVPYSEAGTQVEFSFPNGSTYVARQTVSNTVRFDPINPERIEVPLVPGMQFQARLQGRETEGSYRIDIDADFTFTARSTNPARQADPPERISLSDLAPTWQKVTSTASPQTELFVDSAAFQRAAQRSGRDGEPPYPIGTIDGEARIQHGFGNQLYRPVLEALRDPATTGDVSIAIYGLATTREGRQYTDALLDYATRHPDNRVTIHSGNVQINGLRGEALQMWLSENHPNITITEPLSPGNFRMPHEKIVAIGDQVFIGSEKIGMSMSRKVGFMVELGAEDAQLMHSYIQQLGDPRAPAAERTELLSRLSERGVLIDDPVAGAYPNAAAMNRVLAEAQDHLRIHQSDLTDAVATQRIIDRARDGVHVDLRYRDIDPESKRMLDEAAQRYPNLTHGKVPDDPMHPIYQHENYVISERGGALSSAYMWEPKAGQVPRYTNGGEGGVLLDAAQARQYEHYLDTAPQRTIGPGAVIDLAEEAWSKAVPRLWEQLERVLPGRNQESQPPSQSPPAGTGDHRQSSLSSDTSTVQAALVTPYAPQPGHPAHLAYQQSRDAVQRLNADFNMPYSETSEKLTVAAATVAVQQNLRVDEVALNKPTDTQSGGTTAFVIEKTGNSETHRIGTFSIQQVMGQALDEGYRSLAAAAPPQVSAENKQAMHSPLQDQDTQRQSSPKIVQT